MFYMYDKNEDVNIQELINYVEKYFYIYHKFMTNDVMYYDVSLL